MDTALQTPAKSKASNSRKGLSQKKHAVYQRKRNALKRASTVDTDKVIAAALKNIQDRLTSGEVRAVDLPKVLQSMDKLLERKDLTKTAISPSDELQAFLREVGLPEC